MSKQQMTISEEEKALILKLAQGVLSEEGDGELEPVAEVEECKPKKKMKTSKKALWVGMAICISLLLFTSVMLYLDKDSETLSIFAKTGVGAVPLMFGIYNFNSRKLSEKDMDMNYIENYDEINNLY